MTDARATAPSALADAHPLSPAYDRDRPESTDEATDPTADGRRARGARNRQAVVDAILTLLGDGVASPTAKEIATAAGVSLRSVFRHFEDLDSLFLAAIERQAEHTAHLYEPPERSGTLEDRVAALVSQRRKLYERIFPVRRGWMLRYYDHPRVAAILGEIYAGLHFQIVELFAEDVAGLSAAERREVIDAVDAAASFDTWAHLRAHRELGVNRAAAVLRSMILAQFAAVEA